MLGVLGLFQPSTVRVLTDGSGSPASRAIDTLAGTARRTASADDVRSRTVSKGFGVMYQLAGIAGSSSPAEAHTRKLSMVGRWPRRKAIAAPRMTTTPDNARPLIAWPDAELETKTWIQPWVSWLSSTIGQDWMIPIAVRVIATTKRVM